VLQTLNCTGRRATCAGWILTLSIAVLVAGCGTSSKRAGDAGGYPVGGGDYRRDGPHANPPANLHAVPDAVPRIEPLASGPNRPYVISGKRYVPDTSGRAYRAKGRASWYGRQFHGRPTSSGEPYDMYAMTAAHPTLPIPSYVRVTRPDTGRSIVVRINDRGPFHSGRIIDLSYVAAYKLDTLANGTGEVIVERIMPDEIRSGAALARSAPPVDPIAATLARAPAPVSPAPVSGLTPTATLSGMAGATPVAAAPIAAAGPAASMQLGSLAIPVPHAPPTAVTPSAAAGQGPVSGAAPIRPGAAFLQMGAFSEAANAQQLAERLRPNLAAIGNVEVVATADSRYRVRLGPFDDRNAAVAHVDAVYDYTGIRPHVLVSSP